MMVPATSSQTDVQCLRSLVTHESQRSFPEPLPLHDLPRPSTGLWDFTTQLCCIIPLRSLALDKEETRRKTNKNPPQSFMPWSQNYSPVHTENIFLPQGSRHLASATMSPWSQGRSSSKSDPEGHVLSWQPDLTSKTAKVADASRSEIAHLTQALSHDLTPQ